MNKVILLSALLSLVICDKVFSQGNLLVTPIRVIFDDKKMREDLNVCNIGSDTAVYSISFLHYKMNMDGSFSESLNGDSTVQYADEYLRVFPKRVRLAPNESQTVRLQYRKLPTIKEGEYRSHLYFRVDKTIQPLGYEERKDEKTMSISITPIFGISIPIFIRNGSLKSEVQLSDISLKAVNDSVSKLSVNLIRTGDMSVYGNLSVSHSSATGKITLLTKADGIGIYPELSKRMFTTTIRSKAMLGNLDGKLILTFSKPISEGGIVLSSTEYLLGPQP